MPLQTPILDAYFTDWMKMVFGQDWATKLPEIEQTERRRAFYSGFASYYSFTMETAARSDADAERMLKQLSDEIRSFFEQMKRVPRDPKAN